MVSGLVSSDEPAEEFCANASSPGLLLGFLGGSLAIEQLGLEFRSKFAASTRSLYYTLAALHVAGLWCPHGIFIGHVGPTFPAPT